MAAFDIPTLKENIDHDTVEKVLALDVDKYKYGFETDIESDLAPKGLNEEIVRLISAKKNEPEWMLEWRLDAYRRWLTMTEPNWAKVHYPKIDFQEIHYYAAPKGTKGPKSLDEVDPELLRTYEKLGIPLKEQAILAGVEGAGDTPFGSNVAVDAVFDSVSVVTTFREELAKQGTPEYDHRAYERAVEAERKAADELERSGGTPGWRDAPRGRCRGAPGDILMSR